MSRDREAEAEHRVFADLRLGPDAAVVALDYFGVDGEAEAGALFAGGAAHARLAEGLERHVEFLGRNALPLVADRRYDVAVHLRYPDRDGTAGRGELERVAGGGGVFKTCSSLLRSKRSGGRPPAGRQSC